MMVVMRRVVGRMMRDVVMVVVVMHDVMVVMHDVMVMVMNRGGDGRRSGESDNHRSRNQQFLNHSLSP